MATKITRNKINFKGKTVSIGIDMHKRSWHITALADGEIVLTVTLSMWAAGHGWLACASNTPLSQYASPAATKYKNPALHIVKRNGVLGRLWTILHPLSLSGLPWYGVDSIWMRLCTIPDTTLFGIEHRLRSARARRLKKTNSAAILLKILGTPHWRISQGKPVAGRRSRC